MSTPRLVVLFGAKEAGKTALVNNRLKEKFKDEYKPTVTGLIKVEPVASVILFDLPGYGDLDDVENILTASAKNFSGGLLVFPINNRERFVELPIVLAELKRHVKGPILLVSTKGDLPVADQLVSFDEANNFAKENGIPYFVTSVKSNIGVDNLYSELLEKMNQYKAPENDIDDSQEEIKFGSEESDSDDDNDATTEVLKIAVMAEKVANAVVGHAYSSGLLPIPALAATKETDDTANVVEAPVAPRKISNSPASVARRTELERLLSSRDLRAKTADSIPRVKSLILKVNGQVDLDSIVDANESNDKPIENVQANTTYDSTVNIKPEDNSASTAKVTDPDPLLAYLIKDIKERLSDVGKSRKELVKTLLEKCAAAKEMDVAIAALQKCGDDAQNDHKGKSGSRWFGKGPLFFKVSATKKKTDELIKQYSSEFRV